MLWWWMRRPRADATRWRGRVVVALLDAVLWPGAWIVLALSHGRSLGAVGQAVFVLAVIALAMRVRTALFRNERYFFTTRRWAVPLLGLVVYAGALKIFAG